MSDDTLGGIGFICLVGGVLLCAVSGVLGVAVIAIGAAIFGYFQGRNKKP